MNAFYISTLDPVVLAIIIINLKIFNLSIRLKPYGNNETLRQNRQFMDIYIVGLTLDTHPLGQWTMALGFILLTLLFILSRYCEHMDHRL